MSKIDALRASVRATVGRIEIEAEVDTGAGTLVIVGPNGAGKTSLLSLILGVLPMTRGRIEIGGHVLVDTSAKLDVPIENRLIGYVPQDYALFPHLTVRQNIDFALASRRGRMDRRARSERVGALLDELVLADHADRHPGTLSGGEKQRVALARALSVRPGALLLDEPLAALDIHARRDVRCFLANYLRNLNLPTVVVTHSAEDARLLGHRVAVLEAGKITQCGSFDELAARPATRFVEAFVASRSPLE